MKLEIEKISCKAFVRQQTVFGFLGTKYAYTSKIKQLPL